MTPSVRVAERIGVCGVREDTRRLAEVARQAPPGRALDMGTGTGYVAIWLAAHGWEVDAVDISPRALELARQNAAANEVNVRFFQSDLFSAVNGRYDLIAFNPPMRPDETELSRVVTSILRRSATISALLMRLTHGRLARRRLPFLVRFAREAREHLTPGGRLLLVIGRDEAESLVDRLPGARVAGFTPLRTIPRLGIAEIRFDEERTP
ncbi:MAG TPA: class I SAM-dependent methyltransferase [Caldilineae bacterium]|nr:class I SAM-dependent methyltransferase [Caldilineae bacterium]